MPAVDSMLSSETGHLTLSNTIKIGTTAGVMVLTLTTPTTAETVQTPNRATFIRPLDLIHAMGA